MGIEIERKFLVTGDGWRTGASGVPMRQGYLALGPPASVRVRIEGERALLNIKESTLGLRRDEFEYEIPVADAEELLFHCGGSVIEKQRFNVQHGGRDWEVDVFGGPNAGLVVAEVELDDENERVDLPPWVGEEVSRDPRYRNTYLSAHPYRTWRPSGGK
jgi:adenylate cyclase